MAEPDEPTLKLIPCEPPATDGSLVKLLEDALEQARAGAYSSVTIVFVDRDGATGYMLSKMRSIATMIGGLHMALARCTDKLRGE